MIIKIYKNIIKKKIEGAWGSRIENGVRRNDIFWRNYIKNALNKSYVFCGRNETKWWAW